MSKLHPINVGELIDQLNTQLSAGILTRDHKIVIYSATGKNTLCRILKNPEKDIFSAPATLIMGYTS